jgi:nucleotide-binding universal stress UspA family protein
VGPQYIRDFLAEELRNEHKKIQSYTKQLQLKGIQADGLLISGATVDMILLEIDKLGIDLVVIGRHEHSLIYKFFTGTTYSSIANKSKVPVLIVPL